MLRRHCGLQILSPFVHLICILYFIYCRYPDRSAKDRQGHPDKHVGPWSRPFFLNQVHHSLGPDEAIHSKNSARKQ